jgi:hypothetical protein
MRMGSGCDTIRYLYFVNPTNGVGKLYFQNMRLVGP